MIERKLLLYGFGGHARSVADVALHCGYTHLIFVDRQAQEHEEFDGHPVIASFDLLQGSWPDAIAASGDSGVRQKQSEELMRLGFNLTSVISSLSSVASNAVIGNGCFVGHHAHVGPCARLGNGSILNTSAVVEHDAVVGQFSHVSVNATLAGRARLGNFSMLGAGSIIIDRVEVSDLVTVGAGSVVIRSIASPGIYAGVPCRLIR